MRISQQEVFNNHCNMVDRNTVYCHAGYNVEKNLQFVLSYTLPLAGKILEIGTGKGRFLTALLSCVQRVTTVDSNPKEQWYARLNVAYEKPRGRARFVIANAMKLPWPVYSFDCIVSVNSLHHMKNLGRVVSEIFRVVKPGGKIVLADFNKHGFAIMNKIHHQERRIHESIPYSFDDLVKKFKENDWTVVLRSGDCQDILIAVDKSAQNANKWRVPRNLKCFKIQKVSCDNCRIYVRNRNNKK